MRLGAVVKGRGTMTQTRKEALARIDVGHTLSQLVHAMQAYFRAYAELGTPIGEDGYTDEYAADMLNAAHQLLSAEIGRLDGGEMSAWILKIAADHKLLDENGNISGK